MKNIQIDNGVIYLGEFPEKPERTFYSHSHADAIRGYNEAIISYQHHLEIAIDNRVEFEDQEAIRILLRTDLNIWEHNLPDGFYEVDLPEWEKVCQHRYKVFNGYSRWNDYTIAIARNGSQYRTVIRFKQN